MQLKISEFYHPPSHVPSGQKCLFLAKFLTRLKISWFCPISSFAGFWVIKNLILSQIYNTT